MYISLNMDMEEYFGGAEIQCLHRTLNLIFKICFILLISSLLKREKYGYKNIFT